jgi:hypothetical protein
MGVAVGTGVSVGGTGVSVGTDVSVGGTGVSAGVDVGGRGVTVGATGAAVGERLCRQPLSASARKATQSNDMSLFIDSSLIPPSPMIVRGIAQYSTSRLSTVNARSVVCPTSSSFPGSIASNASSGVCAVRSEPSQLT